MIETVKGIRIKGRCFANDTNLLFFQKPSDRISIVYGKNGSGKSTISEGIKVSSCPECSSDLSVTLVDSEGHSVELKDKKVFVFNEHYVDTNVRIEDDGLGTIVLIGKQVELQAAIDAQESTLSRKNEELSLAQSSVSDFSDKHNPRCPEYHLARVEQLLKQDGGWADVDSQIKGKKIKSPVTQKLVEEIGELTVNETLEDLRNQFQTTRVLLEKVTGENDSFPQRIEKVIIESNFDLSVLDLLAVVINKPVLTQREKRILDIIQGGSQQLVESARETFSRSDTEYCPYCFQPVSDGYKHELLDSISKVLNKEVDEHKAQLLNISFPVLSLDISLFERIDSALAKQASAQLSVCQAHVSEYRAAIEKKIENIYTPIIAQSLKLEEDVQRLNGILDAIEQRRLEYNDAANQKKKLVDSLIITNKKIAHLQITKLYKDYQRQVKRRAITLKRQEELQTAVEEEQNKLDALKQRKSNIRLAIDSINHSLDYVFLSHGRLSIALQNEKYYLKSNGVDVAPNKVSVGERNIIALCYFFTQVLANQEIEKIYQNEALFVIDDPISSFDFENKVGIMSFLRFQANLIIKGNENSKILVLSHDLETINAFRKAMDEICASTKGISGVEPTTYITLELKDLKLKILPKSNSEYARLLEIVYGFASGQINDEKLTIGNEMRRVLEAFSTFTYKKSIEQVSCDPNVLSALANHSKYFENLMYRLVLHGESHFEEQTYSLHDGLNFFQFISEQEKKKTAQSVLCFMYLLNPYHINAYLCTVPRAIETIKRWVNNIPDNKSFEIVEMTTNQHIVPIYSLTLSAGIGNDVFEEIPSEEFTTANPHCDFALCVSGDSMQPDINDGDIVLLKKQNTIDDGVIGAFFLNGKVYCKYLIHEEGKTYLCSKNKLYEPIEITENDDLRVYGVVVEIVNELNNTETRS